MPTNIVGQNDLRFQTTLTGWQYLKLACQLADSPARERDSNVICASGGAIKIKSCSEFFERINQNRVGHNRGTSCFSQFDLRARKEPTASDR